VTTASNDASQVTLSGSYDTAQDAICPSNDSRGSLRPTQLLPTTTQPDWRGDTAFHIDCRCAINLHNRLTCKKAVPVHRTPREAKAVYLCGWMQKFNKSHWVIR